MLKLIPERSTFVGKNAQGKPVLAAQLLCDNCSELADVSEADGNVCGFGSVALAVKEGEICVLASDGVWYKQSNGSPVTAPEDDDDGEEEAENDG